MLVANTLSPWMGISSTIPADIPVFLEKIAEGYDIVSGWRKEPHRQLLASGVSLRASRIG